MTDEMRAREKAICKVAGIKDIGDLSDGFHTFNQLYYQRMMLFATIVKQNRDKAWKSLRHEDGELCFGGGWFIVGVDTPEGSYTYHYEDNYYSLFDCAELECGKHWDGHTEKDVTRLLSLPVLEKQEQDRWIPVTERMPEVNRDVLLSSNMGNVYAGHRDTTDFIYKVTDKNGRELWAYDPEAYTDDIDSLPKTEDCAFSDNENTQSWLSVSSANYNDRFEGITAWRPLPEPYTEEES